MFLSVVEDAWQSRNGGLPLWKEKSRCPTSHELQTRCFLAGKTTEPVELSSVLQFDSNKFFTQKSQRFLLSLTFEVHAVGFRLLLLICSWKVEAPTLSSELEFLNCSFLCTLISHS
ncbi:uncharacterized protein LOC125473210 isoform X2 [Pyrus x bretschneideri]|uniref:uncharacterized protein LOC125473210 isoform X2 n=1 Tax=Pyrus x bretschneideri TaxID=225117 RepID=UPI00202F210B|nr:uncharacterized protein LOC125473210 isoform X2 [Pyrus x bretschneideri]